MDDQATTQTTDFIELAAELVAAYVSNNRVSVSEIPGVIAHVHAALSGLSNAAPAQAAAPEKLTPAQIRKSITPDALISFEDGKPYKTMRRHLTLRGLSPEDYRIKWGLPADYPMTSSSYSAQRSELARSLGLGQQRRKAAPKVAAPNEMISKAPKTRGRPRKAAEESEVSLEASGQEKAAETA